MILSTVSHPGSVPRLNMYRPASSSDKPGANAHKVEIMDLEVADMKRRITIVGRMIADFDRLAADLDREIRIEEDRVRIHNPADVAYSTYAKATTLRRDNLRRSADELRVQQAKAQKALLALGEAVT